MDVDELSTKYAPSEDVAVVGEAWRSDYDEALLRGVHGHGCAAGATCQVRGRRRRQRGRRLRGAVLRAAYPNQCHAGMACFTRHLPAGH